MLFERGHVRITGMKRMTACTPHPPPGCCPLSFNKLFAVFIETCHLCRAAVSPGDAYPAAQGAGKPVHGITHRSPQLLSGGQTLDVTAVPHHPACQGQEHQKGSWVHQQISKVLALDLQGGKDSQQQGYDPQQVHQHSKHQSQLTVGQAVVFSRHSCTWKHQRSCQEVIR